MFLKLSPWVALVLGILIGWLLELLVEILYFRRRRADCERSLKEIQADLQARDAELRGVRVQAASLEADLAATRARLAAPTVKAELPKVELPEVALPKVDLAAPSLAAALPGVELPKVELPEVELPQVDLAAPTLAAALPEVEMPKVELPQVELPKVELPKVDLAAPSLAAALPEVELPKIELPEVELPKVELPKVELPEVGLPEVELPQVDLAAPSLAAALPKVELPKVELPKVELPKVDLAAPSLAAALPKVELPEVELPKVELPQVDLAAPSLAAALPEVELPKVELPEVELPKIELPGVEAPKADVVWPEVAAAVAAAGVALPAAGVQPPSIGAELPAAGVTLPEGAVAALAPGIEMGHDDLARIDGIGPKYATQLAAAGITSFAALAAAEPDQIKQIIAAPEWRQTDYAAWITEAKTLAAAPRRVLKGDDLTLLEGIGPVYAAKLNAAGITTFAQLADADDARLADLIQAPAWRRVNYGEWREQAALAAAGDEVGLKALQDRLFSRKGDNLGLVSGLGEKTVAALGAAGITSYAALAKATPDRLAEITRSAGVRGGDFAAWIEEAKLRAAGKRIPRVRRARAAVKMSACPQDLSRVHGIGAVYEQKLYAAGIGTFWDLAQADAADLARILEVKEFQAVDFAALKADALRLADETGSLERSWDGSAPDDFEPLEGIGEVYEGRLYDAGICTFRALANATVEQLAAICKAPEWRRPDYAGWIAQARRLSGM